MMKLPEEFERQLWHEIEIIEVGNNMQYVTSVERFETKKIFQQGEAKMLSIMLKHRFGLLPEWVSDKLSSAGEQDLERWGEVVLTVPTLDAVFDDSKNH